MSTATCRSCGAGISWHKTSKGKSIPLDVVPAFNGNVWVDASGIARFTKPYPPGPRFLVHFVTCAYADRHRKAKAK